jgi:alkylated DNA repair protein (DNA oxidative demethylase)
MPASRIKAIAAKSYILSGYAESSAESMLKALEPVLEAAPLREVRTPRGFKMAARMSNCGAIGWVSDSKGYRYEPHDPQTGCPWPAIPDVILNLARQAAADCGFADFSPDVCLINQYQPGAGMGLHQDKDERDFSAPIVSISLGAPIVFMFGGMQRRDKPDVFLLQHGDVVVWGGEDRLRFHGVKPLKLAHHPLTGQRRFNLTLRQAL